MHSFHYQDGRLHCEKVDLQALALVHGTPAYVYSAATIRDHYQRLASALSSADPLICYATKANSNLAILKILAAMGSGFDIVSGGELYRVLKAGGQAAKTTFAGVGKTREEIEFALAAGVYCFNVESEAEIQFIHEIAKATNKTAPIALRVNPNVDAKTHHYISTGKSENKFGIDYAVIPEAYRRAAKLSHIQLKGLHMHIGSQLTSIQPFLEAVRKIAPLVTELKDQHDIEFWSIGGGIGIVYEDSLPSGVPEWWQAQSKAQASPLTIETYAQTLLPHLETLGVRILLEPGRYIVGNAGVMLTQVLHEKRGAAKIFQIVDAGMNDLIRPALYQGHHDIIPLLEPPADAKLEQVDVVGPVCESGDFFAQDRELPPLQRGDVLALMSSGAYGFVMASNYNSRPMPVEILVEGSAARVIRQRQTYEDLIRGEMM